MQRIEHASVSRALARTTLSEPPSDELDETCAALEAGCMVREPPPTLLALLVQKYKY